jgi:hypothetical protein
MPPDAGTLTKRADPFAPLESEQLATGDGSFCEVKRALGN